MNDAIRPFPLTPQGVGSTSPLPGRIPKQAPCVKETGPHDERWHHHSVLDQVVLEHRAIDVAARHHIPDLDVGRRELPLRRPLQRRHIHPAWDEDVPDQFEDLIEWSSAGLACSLKPPAMASRSCHQTSRSVAI